MSFTNKIEISGRVVKDAVRVGAGPFRFSIATGGAKKRGSEERWPTEYFDCICWHDSAAEVKRGAEVLVVGRLRQSAWEKDGQKYSRVEIVAQTITDAKEAGPYVPAFAGDAPPTTKKYELPSRVVEHGQKVAEARPVTADDPITDSDIPF
jgi:single-strand DNA-binding protein